MWLDKLRLTGVYVLAGFPVCSLTRKGSARTPPYTILLRLSACHRFLVAIARGPHLFPFRTEPLSPAAPMVLPYGGRVGRRQVPVEPPDAFERRGALSVCLAGPFAASRIVQSPFQTFSARRSSALRHPGSGDARPPPTRFHLHVERGLEIGMRSPRRHRRHVRGRRLMAVPFDRPLSALGGSTRREPGRQRGRSGQALVLPSRRLKPCRWQRRDLGRLPDRRS